MPGNAGNNVIATKGQQMLEREFGGCAAGSSLVRFDPAMNVVRDALLRTVGAAGVIAVLAYT